MTIPTPSPSDPEPEKPESRPLPCPNCESSKGFTRTGKFRSQCLNCNSLVSNAEIGRDDIEPQ